MSLWCTICGSRLLSDANLILFFNKVLGFVISHALVLMGRVMQMDILQATLTAGITLRRYIPGYADRPNNVSSVVQCTLQCHHPATPIPMKHNITDFKEKFRDVHVRSCLLPTVI